MCIYRTVHEQNTCRKQKAQQFTLIGESINTVIAHTKCFNATKSNTINCYGFKCISWRCRDTQHMRWRVLHEQHVVHLQVNHDQGYRYKF